MVNIEQFIDKTYADLSMYGIIPRQTQIQASKNLANSFLKKTNYVLEAPTGTGKTMCYLIAALAVRHVSGIAANFVIATATKALQQQIIEKDVPLLVKAGMCQASDFAIAKGKSNYICLKKAQDSVSAIMEDGDEDFFSEDASMLGLDEIQELVDAYHEGHWDGDFEMYKFITVPSRSSLRMRTESCLEQHCPMYAECAYYKTQTKWMTSKYLIANIDLVLLNHKAVGNILPFASYHLIVDEGHQLPRKAIETGTSHAYLSQLTEVQKKLPITFKLMQNIKGAMTLYNNCKEIPPVGEVFDHTTGLTLLEAVEAYLLVMDKTKMTDHYLADSKIDPRLVSAVSTLAQFVGRQALAFDKYMMSINQFVKANEDNKIYREFQVRIQEVAVPLIDAGHCLRSWVSNLKNRYACWIEWNDDQTQYSFHCTPVDSAALLKPLVWDLQRDTEERPRLIEGVAITSATLRDLNTFNRIKTALGANSTTTYEALPHSFPYQESTLTVAEMKSSPKPAERAKYFAEIREMLPKIINKKEGTLILANSWAILREIEKMLESSFYGMVKVQGTMTAKHLIDSHKADIDAGKGSILLGVQTLSEGTDLPGKYCTHVIISSIPFSSPDNPVEEKLQELLGDKYFNDRSLPDASIRLVQMVGRLIRRETDKGRVTVLDHRLASTNYGQKLLRSLPPFKIERK